MRIFNMARSIYGWQNAYPKFTNITALLTAKQYLQNTPGLYPHGRFDLSWSFENTLDEDVIEVNLYRLIGAVDSNLYNPRTVSLQKYFKKIKTWTRTDNSSTPIKSYTDTLDDLDLNGFTTDSQQEIVVDEIMTLHRAMYYRVECKIKSMSNFVCPMMFVCDGGLVVALSTKAQVIQNKFYNEGDVVWSVTYPSRESEENFVRIAVDLYEDLTQSRGRKVWATTTRGGVVCFDYWTGETLASYKEAVKLPIYAMALDATTGDLIYHVGNRATSKISYTTSTGTLNTSIIGSTLIPNSTRTNFEKSTTGAVCTFESGDVMFYVISDYEKVIKINVTKRKVEQIIGRTHFGCDNQTTSNQYNIFGITKGLNQSVWVNGHTPLHFYESYQIKKGTKYQGKTAGKCRKYVSLPSTASQYSDWQDLPLTKIEYGNQSQMEKAYRSCNRTHNQWLLCKPMYCKLSSPAVYAYDDLADHLEVRQIDVLETVYRNVPILQDIGYVYGCNINSNYWATNGQYEDLSSNAISSTTNYRAVISANNAKAIELFRPITRNKSSRNGGYWGDSPMGQDKDVFKPYVALDTFEDPTTNTKTASSQLGMAVKFPTNGMLYDFDSQEVVQTNLLEKRIHFLTYNPTASSLTYPTAMYLSAFDNLGWSTKCPYFYDDTGISGRIPKHASVDDNNGTWVFSPSSVGASAGVYNLRSNVNNTTFPYGLQCTYPPSASCAYGNRNHNSSPEQEYSLILKYANSGSVAKGETITLDSAIQYLAVNTYPPETYRKSNVYNKTRRIYGYFDSSGVRGVSNNLYTYRFAQSIDPVMQEYNSDNTGIGCIYTLGYVRLDADFIHPTVVEPSGSLVITKAECTSESKCNTELESIWSDHTFVSSNAQYASGYDNLTTTHYMSGVNMGGYEPLGTQWKYNDPSQLLNSYDQLLSDSDNIYIFTESNNHWLIPNVYGRPDGEYLNSGVLSVTGSVLTNPNLYSYAERSSTMAARPIGINYVDVYERWGTAELCALTDNCDVSEEFWSNV